MNDPDAGITEAFPVPERSSPSGPQMHSIELLTYEVGALRLVAQTVCLLL
jgi:hypothetical protein